MFEQHPLIPLFFSVILLIIVLQQCFVKRRFLKFKIAISFLLTFGIVLILFFYAQIKENQTLFTVINWILLASDVAIAILLFSCFDFTFSNQKFNKELTKSLDETKYYVILDKKDRIKEISTLLVNDLEIEASEAYGKNFFDLLELKYRIVGFNGERCYKNDIKAFYNKYDKRVIEGQKNKLEIELQEENYTENALYFIESTIFHSGKYKGRILMGEMKNEENLIGMEQDLETKSTELELIKNRFVTILEKTNEGIYFTDLENGYIWCNDTLVKKLSLNGNSISLKEFYKLIHPDDLAFYEEKMKNMNASEYSISYRFDTGRGYVCVKEEGRKIVLGRTIELCGVMTPIDNFKFAKTDTFLDTLGGEPELLAKLSSLEREDKIFEVVSFKVASLPEINEKFGRAIGNSVLSQYVNTINQNFVNNNQIYRVGGLDFVAIITDFRKMEMLKNNLMNSDKLVCVKSSYLNQTVETVVYMGISKTDDHPSHKNTLKRANEALRYCMNPNYTLNFAFYKDM